MSSDRQQTSDNWDAMVKQKTAPVALTREQVIQKLVDKFLAWPLPDSVCSDLCATKQGYPHRSGTTLLAAHEAKSMFEYVLAELFDALAQQAQEVEIVKHGRDLAWADRDDLAKQLATLQVTLAERERDIAKLKAEINEVWVDEHGTAWTRPTAWAYAMVCKARDTHEQQVARLRELLFISKCASCDGCGWYGETDPVTGEPVQAQCRYCTEMRALRETGAGK